MLKIDATHELLQRDGTSDTYNANTVTSCTSSLCRFIISHMSSKVTIAFVRSLLNVVGGIITLIVSMPTEAALIYQSCILFIPAGIFLSLSQLSSGLPGSYLVGTNL